MGNQGCLDSEGTEEPLGLQGLQELWALGNLDLMDCLVLQVRKVTWGLQVSQVSMDSQVQWVLVAHLELMESAYQVLLVYQACKALWVLRGNLAFVVFLVCLGLQDMGSQVCLA